MGKKLKESSQARQISLFDRSVPACDATEGPQVAGEPGDELPLDLFGEVAATALQKRLVEVGEPSRLNAWAGVNDVKDLRDRILACRDCALRTGAKGVVFGDGDPHARIMLVGEGPGQQEDESGVPFVGRAGRLLDGLLGEVGLSRKETFIANIVKCRPPGNRLPEPSEVEACLPHLRAQFRVIRPRLVVLLGALASQTLVDPSLRVTRDRGKWFEKDGISYLVTFHPAAVLRDETGKRGQVLADFLSLKVKWEEICSKKA